MQCQQDGPRLLVPDRPGLGVEMDEALAARESVEVVTASAPRQRFLRRNDGSITNA